MIYVNELLKLPKYWRKVIKKLECTKLKLLINKWSIYSNNVCLTKICCQTTQEGFEIEISVFIKSTNIFILPIKFFLISMLFF